MELDVRNVPDRSRYEAYTEGTLAGYAFYKLADSRVVFTHTVIEPAYEGQGVGSTLVRRALEDVRDRQLSASARCSFVQAWVARHPEYADVVPNAG